MKHYLFACAHAQEITRHDTLVATGTLREVKALGDKFNRCEYYIMTEQDEVVFQSWVHMQPLAVEASHVGA